VQLVFVFSIFNVSCICRKIRCDGTLEKLLVFVEQNKAVIQICTPHATQPLLFDLLPFFSRAVYKRPLPNWAAATILQLLPSPSLPQLASPPLIRRLPDFG
jgi:hypothetical protein